MNARELALLGYFRTVAKDGAVQRALRQASLADLPGSVERVGVAFLSCVKADFPAVGRAVLQNAQAILESAAHGAAQGATDYASEVARNVVGGALRSVFTRRGR